MLLKITIQSQLGHFFGGNDIDLLSGEFYRSNELPCKTTILGMLCYSYDIDFNMKVNGIALKENLINQFSYGICNNALSYDTTKSMYSSSYNRTVANRPQLFTKEYTKNIDLILYIHVNNGSDLESYIKNNIQNGFNVPGMGDKNLFPEIFNIEEVKDYAMVEGFNGLFQTNVFYEEDINYMVVANSRESITLSYNRFDYNGTKKHLVVFHDGEKDIPFNVATGVIIVNNKGIRLL